ncbi:MAG: hypothetical protein LBE09_04910, partial [Christensenellaceae bacterium]|nr:hypothetical protein [Christensenellaceae bacterium]
MKERNMKKAFTILFQIASIILLSLFFVTSFFVFLGKPNKLTNTDAVYTYTSLPLIVNTTQVQK